MALHALIAIVCAVIFIGAEVALALLGPREANWQACVWAFITALWVFISLMKGGAQ